MLTTGCGIRKMATPEIPKTCKVILPDTIARNMLAEVKDTLKKIHRNRSSELTLVAFLANDDPHAVKYAEYSRRISEEK